MFPKRCSSHLPLWSIISWILSLFWSQFLNFCMYDRSGSFMFSRQATFSWRNWRVNHPTSFSVFTDKNICSSTWEGFWSVVVGFFLQTSASFFENIVPQGSRMKLSILKFFSLSLYFTTNVQICTKAVTFTKQLFVKPARGYVADESGEKAKQQ